jgi:hypothetical protein
MSEYSVQKEKEKENVKKSIQLQGRTEGQKRRKSPLFSIGLGEHVGRSRTAEILGYLHVTCAIVWTALEK